jgi:O-antigen/teichoic acid export membrane protein
MARQTLSDHAAGVYAATTVAAKLVVWVSVGIGLWVVPEATRRAAAGQDPRKVLARALGLVALLAVPSLAIFAAFPRLLLKLAFGPDYQSGDRVLLILGLAFALLAATYVTVQFLLGLHRRGFVVVLGVVALAEPLLLLEADTLRSFAWRVLIVQVVAAIALLVIGARVRRDPLAGSEPVL